MFKYLIIFFIVVLSLIYFGNYLDYKNNKMDRAEYNRRVRLFFFLVVIIFAIVVWLRKR
ncbi:hypothetical protein [Pedobacter sp. KBW06]|uniref:hypothetical protein n=1 Tax=Pedobacter sp. KBW06 TaxID=2153359 RepID=UPI001315219A|nr:hypothetical protein [Pedobacter sp. KBW06]